MSTNEMPQRDARKRDPVFEERVALMRMNSIFFHAASPRHAATEENPRPLPDHNLINTLKHLRLTEGFNLVDKWGIRDSICFAACTNRYRADPEWMLTLPAEELKWLCAEFDMVLISDRVTHHWTSLNTHVNVPGRVHFQDLWPEDFSYCPVVMH
ncbi:hypothetical protein [Chitinophaga pinensis]|uniref:Uncharacterized protein n=1 Tax=Chitinophaga pinensis TaxID=79329 RepID=A0A5C6LJL8_9BACT|nr:hypothetical protein [Chitinophaga pinensis]TWV89101.1 hypothetical protein FEF09_30165 [Chitinophaga pinensis]